MRRPAPLALVLLLLLALLPATFAGDEDEPLDDSADDKVPFGEQVNRAIDQGTKWLLQRPVLFRTGDHQMAWYGLIRGTRLSGGGEGVGYGHPAGATALALYTLLKCGVDPEHEIVKRGFNWLKEEHSITKEYDDVPGAQGFRWSYYKARGSYELAAEILALTAKYDHYKRTKNTKLRWSRGKLKIKDKFDHQWLQDLVAQLVEQRGLPIPNPAPGTALGWRYNLRSTTLQRGRQKKPLSNDIPPPHANQDLSSTQLAALALYNAHQFSVRVDAQVWVDIVEFTLSHQEPDGPVRERVAPGIDPPPKDRARGFMYIKGSPDPGEGIATGSMTACGVANLLMARDALREIKKGKALWKKLGLEERVDRAIHDGLAWLDLNWSAWTNPKRGGYQLYYLYGVERAMDLYGKNLIGKHVWYTEGAKQILAHQNPVKVKDPIDENAPETQGTCWMTRSTHEPKDVLDTCFALLFLKRATK